MARLSCAQQHVEFFCCEHFLPEMWHIDENKQWKKTYVDTLINVITHEEVAYCCCYWNIHLFSFHSLLAMQYSLKCTKNLLLRFILRPSYEFIIRSFLVRLFSLPQKPKMSYQNMSNLPNPKPSLNRKRERERGGKMEHKNWIAQEEWRMKNNNVRHQIYMRF